MHTCTHTCTHVHTIPPISCVFTYIKDILHYSELFTNCLDMLGSLLHSLPTDFHISLATGGEEGKKVYTSCIKKLKSELSSAKSACLSEIQQLFPLTQKSYTVITVKQPPSTQKGHSAGERIKVIWCCHIILFEGAMGALVRVNLIFSQSLRKVQGKKQIESERIIVTSKLWVHSHFSSDDM